jgi:hypothetical protein
MSQDRPTAAELVDAVREFLEGQVMPKLEGHTAFHLRVAINALGIVERELSFAPGFDRAEHQRLVEILGHDGELDTLNHELSARIRAGDFDDLPPALAKHLMTTVLDKLAIANPRYTLYLRHRGQKG